AGRDHEAERALVSDDPAVTVPWARAFRRRQLEQRRPVLRDDDHGAVLGIDRGAPEVRPAVVAGHLNRVPEAWRCEQPVVPRAADVLEEARLFRGIVDIRAEILFRE